MENEEKVSVKEEVVSCLNSTSKSTAITTTAEVEKNVESAVDSRENTVDEENGADSDRLENEQQVNILFRIYLKILKICHLIYYYYFDF